MSFQVFLLDLPNWFLEKYTLNWNSQANRSSFINSHDFSMLYFTVLLLSQSFLKTSEWQFQYIAVQVNRKRLPVQSQKGCNSRVSSLYPASWLSDCPDSPIKWWQKEVLSLISFFTKWMQGIYKMIQNSHCFDFCKLMLHQILNFHFSPLLK